MMKKRGRKILASMLALAIALTGCAPKSADSGQEDGENASVSAQSSEDGKTLTIGTTYTVSTFVPWKSTSDGDRYILSNVYESLIEYDTQGNFLPGLAESWENTDDLTWVFHLRDNSFWQTGNDLFGDEKIPVTAQDVKNVFDFVMDEKNEAARRSSLTESIVHIEVVDDSTIKFIKWDNDLI